MRERDIFIAALSQNTAEREAFLAAACAGDEDLRRRVDDLLMQHEKEKSFILDSPLPGVNATIIHPSERPGSEIGPYKLLQQIGEGGMGTVYMAEQIQPVQRRVAIKVIKSGMDSRDVIARFEAERQALAMMDHVNIARVLDAGTTEAGRPYFVMELVHGVPITTFCDDNHLTPRQRLELFVPVCQAIQHAHQKGIIHRDIKPSNVMVTLYDGKPVPKVIDFGVAKATEQKLTDRTLFTQYGVMVGTLEYMSPEQAEMSALGVDTRSDIYSLGVLLYELLTGGTPLGHKRIKEAAFAEILRLIKDEEPPRPSTRLGESGEALASISAQRQMEPVKLTRLLRGELDWIVMKTLEKNRNQRYESASGLAADLQRYLDDDPVQACPPSAGYRFRKFARRNRRILGTVAVVSVALVMGTAISTWQAIRATRAENLAETRLTKSNANFVVAEEQRKEAEAQRQRALASEADAKAKQTLAQDARKEVVQSLQDAMAAVDLMLTRVAKENLYTVPQMEPVRLELMQDALNFYKRFLKQKSDDPAIRLQTAMAFRRLAEIQGNLGQHAEAVQSFRDAFAMFEEFQGRGILEPGMRCELSLAYIDFGYPLAALGKSQEHDTAIRRAVELAEDLVRELPHDPKYLDQLARANFHLAEMLIAHQQPKAAEKILRRNLTLTKHPSYLADSYMSLSSILSNDNKSSEAEQAIRQALTLCEAFVAESPASSWSIEKVGSALYRLANFLAANGRSLEAEKTCCQAISVFGSLATDYPSTPHFRSSLALVQLQHAELLEKLNRTAEAEPELRRATELYKKLSNDFPTSAQYRSYVAVCSMQWAGLLAASNRPREAVEAYRLALDAREKLVAEFPNQTDYRAELGWGSRKLAVILRQQLNEGAEADDLHRRDVDIFEKLSAEFKEDERWREQLAHAHRAWSIELNRCGKLVAADIELRKAVRVLQKSLTDVPDSGHHGLLDDTYRGLMNQLVTSRGEKEAEQAIQEIVAELEALGKKYPEVHRYRRSLASAHDALGRLFKNNGRMTEAEPANNLACEILEKLIVDYPTEEMYRNDLIYMKGNGFILAMANWKLNHKEDALKCFDHAEAWMEKNAKDNAELIRSRNEAAELMKDKP